MLDGSLARDSHERDGGTPIRPIKNLPPGPLSCTTAAPAGINARGGGDDANAPAVGRTVAQSTVRPAHNVPRILSNGSRDVPKVGGWGPLAVARMTRAE